MKEINENKMLYLLLGILLLVIFFVGTSILKSKRGQVIDYSEIKSAQELLDFADVTYDRETYYILDNIIDNYICSYAFENTIEGNVGYKDYYDVLNSSYRYDLSKNDYVSKAEKFLKRFLVTSQGNMEKQCNLVTRNVIRKIYKLDNDMYLCTVGLKDNTDYGYIGIKLDKINKTYEIFYLE